CTSSPCSVLDWWSGPKPKTKCRRFKCRWYSCCQVFSSPDSFSPGKPCRGFFMRSARCSPRPISSHSCERSFCAAQICSNTGRSLPFSLGCRPCCSPSAHRDSEPKSRDFGVRYPQVANALIVIKFLCNLLATCSNEYSSAPCALQSLSQRLLRYSGGSE